MNTIRLVWAAVAIAAVGAPSARAAGAVSEPMTISTGSVDPAAIDPKVRLSNALASKNWKVAVEACNACADSLDDVSLVRIFRKAAITMQQERQFHSLEEISHYVLTKHLPKTKTVTLAANAWVFCGAVKDKTSALARLKTLMKQSVPAEAVSLVFTQCFYSDTSDTNNIKRLCAFGPEIMAYGHGDTNVNQIVTMRLLDGCFLCGEYDRAVELIKAGIPSKDAEWHRAMLPKVQAHAYLAHGQYAEAIACFRAFMKGSLLKPGTKDEKDPITGIEYCREWLLARNANRIGTIYRDHLKDAASAAKAYAEAKEYFRAALKRTQNNPAARQLLVKEIKEDGFAKELGIR